MQISFNNNNSWTAPFNGTVTFEAFGAGGGGGANNNTGTHKEPGGGGGGGGYANNAVTVTAGTVYTITCGAAGSGGVNNNNGANGGNSSVVQGATTICNATGGVGGNLNNHNGAGGSTTGEVGSTTVGGGNGNNGNNSNNNGGGGGASGSNVGAGVASTGVAGAVATGDGGSGGAGGGNNANGTDGVFPGGGGGGAGANSLANKHGGNGAVGKVTITWTAPTLGESWTQSQALSVQKAASAFRSWTQAQAGALVKAVSKVLSFTQGKVIFPSTSIVDSGSGTNATPPSGWSSGFASGSSLQRISNQIKASASGVNNGLLSTTFPGGAIETYVTLATAPVSTGLALYLSNSAGTSYYLFSANNGGGQAQIFVSAGFATVGSAGTIGTVSAGDMIGFSTDGLGNFYGWYKPSGGSWTLICSGFDTTFTPSGWTAGVRVGDTTVAIINVGGGASIPSSAVATMSRQAGKLATATQSQAATALRSIKKLFAAVQGNAGFPTTPILDSFPGSTLSASWNPAPYIEVSAPSVSGGQAYGGDALWGTSFSVPVEAYYTIEGVGGTGETFFIWLLVTGPAGTLNGYLANFNSVGNTVKVYRYTGGSPTQLGATISWTPSIGDQVGVSIDAVGTITAYQNGNALGTRSDTTYTTGKIGFDDAGSGATNGIKNFGGGIRNPSGEAGVFQRLISKTIIPAQGTTALSFVAQKLKVVALSFTQASSAAYSRQVSAFRAWSQSESGVLARAAGKTISVTQTTAATLKRAGGKFLSITQSESGTETRTDGKLVSSTQASSASESRGAGKQQLATQTQTSRLARATGKLQAFTQAQTGSLGKNAAIARAWSQTQAGALVKAVTHALSVVAQASTAAMATVKNGGSHAFTQTLTFTQTQAASLQRQVSAIRTWAQTQAGGLVKAVTGFFSVGEASSASEQRQAGVVTTATQTQAVSFKRATSAFRAWATTESATLAKQIAHSTAATQGQTASESRASGAFVLTSQGGTLTLTRQVSITRLASQATVAQLVKAVAKTIKWSEAQTAAMQTSHGRYLTVTATQSEASTYRRAVTKGQLFAATAAFSLSKSIGAILAWVQQQIATLVAIQPILVPAVFTFGQPQGAFAFQPLQGAFELGEPAGAFDFELAEAAFGFGDPEGAFSFEMVEVS